MAVKKYKPTSPGRRFMAVSSFEDVTKKAPEKSLLEPLKKTGGRNNNGRITTRHQGGGHNRQYRHQVLDPVRNEPVEMLCLRGELTAVPSFEFALRERVSRLATAQPQ